MRSFPSRSFFLSPSQLTREIPHVPVSFLILKIQVYSCRLFTTLLLQTSLIYFHRRFSSACRERYFIIRYCHRFCLGGWRFLKASKCFIEVYLDIRSKSKFFYSPTDAQVNCLKNNFQICIKIDIKTAPTCFGAITIISERIIRSC
jgi:hypothetical protein